MVELNTDALISKVSGGSPECNKQRIHMTYLPRVDGEKNVRKVTWLTSKAIPVASFATWRQEDSSERSICVPSVYVSRLRSKL